MATEVKIGSGGEFFLGEDKIVRLEVLDGPPSASASAPVDVSGWTLVLDVRLRESDAAALLSVAGVVSGSYNAVRATNTQRVTFTFTDTLTESMVARTYRYSVKRTDPGNETIIAYGPFVLERATQTA